MNIQIFPLVARNSPSTRSAYKREYLCVCIYIYTLVKLYNKAITYLLTYLLSSSTGIIKSEWYLFCPTEALSLSLSLSLSLTYVYISHIGTKHSGIVFNVELMCWNFMYIYVAAFCLVGMGVFFL